MNKFFNKIVGASLAIAMMIGVGVAASNKETTEVNAAGADTTKYQLINSVGDLEAGKSYILTNGTSGTVKAAAVTSNANNRKTTSATIDSSNQISRGSSILSFTLGGESGAWTFLTENYAGTNGYFASAASGNNNYLRVISTESQDAHTATITFSGNAAVITIEPHGTRNKIMFNATADNNKGCFACYSSGQSSVYLFKEVAASAYVTGVTASIKDGTYYAGDKLSASDFLVTASWSEGEDTHPENDFTWTVNGVLNGTLELEQNTIVVTYGGVKSNDIHLTGSPRPATSINIEQESVIIDSIGETATLTATVLPENTSDTISWESSDDKVASVDGTGKVTAVAAGTITITATAGSVSDTCSVTVRNNVKATIDFTNRDYNITKPSSAQSQPITAVIGNYSLNLLNSHNTGGTSTYLMMGTSQLSTSNSLVSNKQPVPGAITKVVFTTSNSASTSATYNAVISSTEVLAKVTDETNSLTGKGSLTVTADPEANLHYFAISCVTSKYNGQIASIEIYYIPSAVKANVQSLNTKASLSYTYSAPANNPSAFQNVAIRFGGQISKTLWDELDDLYKVEGYGVMLAPTTSLKGDTIEEDYKIVEDLANGFDNAFEEKNGVSYVQDTEIKNFYNGVATSPAIDGNNYFWNLYKGINNTEVGLTKGFTAVAYIKTTYSGVVFLDEISKSAAQLAGEMDAANPELDATLDGSLSYLASLAQNA